MENNEKIAQHEILIGKNTETIEETRKNVVEVDVRVSEMDKSLALFIQSIERTIEVLTHRDEEFQKQLIILNDNRRENVEIQTQIYAELQEMKSTQDLTFGRLEKRFDITDEKLEKVETALEKEIINTEEKLEEQINIEKIERKRLEQAFNDRSKRTKIDWYEMLTDGIDTVLKQAFQIAIKGGLIYIVYYVIQKFI